jgi:hypothetical protein
MYVYPSITSLYAIHHDYENYKKMVSGAKIRTSLCIKRASDWLYKNTLRKDIGHKNLDY